MEGESCADVFNFDFGGWERERPGAHHWPFLDVGQQVSGGNDPKNAEEF